MSLSESTELFRETFASDLELVRTKAESHGVGLHRTTPDRPLAPHSYNLVLPAAKTAQSLLTAKHVAIGCMDARQVVEAQNTLNPDVFIANAGGGVQPNQERRGATAQFVKTIHQKNPQARVTLAGHLKVCGGGEHFSGGQFSKAHVQGPQTEESLVIKHLKLTAEEAIQQRADPTRIKLAIVEIDSNDKFRQVRFITWP